MVISSESTIFVNMKRSKKIVRRLNDMGVINDINPLVFTRRGNRNGSFSWCVSSGVKDIGSSRSMQECLKWKRWIYSPQLNEIFEYHEGEKINLGEIVEEEN